MIEDTKLTQFCIAPLEPDWIFSAEEGEVAYALKEIFHGICETKEEETLQSIVTVSPETLGFELDMEVDMLPFSLTTFLADKSVNAPMGMGITLMVKNIIKSIVVFNEEIKSFALFMKVLMRFFRQLSWNH